MNSEGVTAQGAFAYIYHVIGTLDWAHIERSLESLDRQDIHWDAFFLYNGGDFPTEDIIGLVPGKFDDYFVFPYDRETPKSAVADWEVQMRKIVGYDRYFVHKADFYLADGVCRAFEEIQAGSPWFTLFHKLDMKERATLTNLRDLAALDWEEVIGLEVVGSYSEHMGKLGVLFRQDIDGVDGTMHGYTDDIRPLFRVPDQERQMRWGTAHVFHRLRSQATLVTDPRLFALHMFHDVPEKNDETKLVRGERF